MKRISNLKKTLALFLALVMSLSLTVCAMAAGSTGSTATGIRISITDGSTVSYYSNGTGATAAEALASVAPNVDLNDYSKGYWMYTYDGVFGTVGASEQTVKNDDVLAFYLVPDYNKDTYALLDNTTAIMKDGWMIAKEGSALCGMVENFDMTTPYVRDNKDLQFELYDGSTWTAAQNSAVSATTQAVKITSTDSSVLGTVIPVKVVSTYAGYETEISAMLDTLEATVVAMDKAGSQPTGLMDLVNEAKSATNVDDMAYTVAKLGYIIYDEGAELSGPRLATASFGYELSVSKPFDPNTYSYTLYNTSEGPIYAGTEVTLNFTPLNNSEKEINLAITANGKSKSNGDSCALEAGENTFVVTLTSDGKTSTYTFEVTALESSASTGIYAFLPAPGQFTNEGVTTGGWGDIYNADGSLKKMRGTVTATGVSLGFFGGYVVFDMGEAGITNDPTHPYGVDFIVYGNAFWNNSEPGCIQVGKEVKDENGKVTGVKWYDIAGSLYYDQDTIRNAHITYDNPNVAEDASITTAGPNLGKLAPVSYSGSESGTITTNSFHNHSWFPLNANYFVGRYGNSELAKVNELPFVSQTPEDGVTKTLTMDGVILGGITATNDTAKLGFGYCDVHQNNSGNVDVAYNPYQTFTSASDFTSKTTGTGGGDPIDLAWAVDENGTPAGLTDKDVIRYVRIYTGAAAMNGIFGEISTEVCGIAAATGTGTGVAKSTPDIYFGESEEPMDLVSGGTTVAASGTYSLVSSADHVYVNGTDVTDAAHTEAGYELTLEGGQTAQVITQTGTESPFLTLLAVS